MNSEVLSVCLRREISGEASSKLGADAENNLRGATSKSRKAPSYFILFLNFCGGTFLFFQSF